MFEKNSHCSYCGHAFNENEKWPRTCAKCGNITFLNPLPVVVVLVPIDDGLVVIRRGVEPHKGILALPGGYIHSNESWQEAGAREVLEETGIHISPEEIRAFDIRSAADGTLLIFGFARKRTSAQIPPFTPHAESTERKILRRPAKLAFDSHTEAVNLFFLKRPIGII